MIQLSDNNNSNPFTSADTNMIPTITAPRTRKATRKTMTNAEFVRSTIKEETAKVRKTVNYNHPIDATLVAVGADINNKTARTTVGLIIAVSMAIVPVACYVAGHTDLAKVFACDLTGATFKTAMILLAFLGGLGFSATKVAGFIGKAFGSEKLGWGASILIELSMTFTSSVALSYACLAVLVTFNVIAAASYLAKR